MKVRMDTHSFIRFAEGNTKLSTQARMIIEDPANDKLLSLASIWEMAIKISLGRLRLTQPFDRFIPHQLQTNGFEIFDIDFDHVAKVAQLPFYHRNPFDRLLVAQSLVEQVPIVSAEVTFDHYAVHRLW